MPEQPGIPSTWRRFWGLLRRQLRGPDGGPGGGRTDEPDLDGTIGLVFLAEKNWRHGVLVTRMTGGRVAALGVVVAVAPSISVGDLKK